MNDVFKVMLATDADFEKLRFPCLASIKLDGIRAYVRNGVVLGRSNKPIPNKHVQNLFCHLEHFDGELIVGQPNHPNVMQNTMSGVMSVNGTPDVTYYAFDYLKHIDLSYSNRFRKLHADIYKYASFPCFIHPNKEISSLNELFKYESKVVNAGYEGLILRDPNTPYKCGRSTVREGYLLKVKRFVDDEAVVIGFEERMHNGNVATVNELGRTKRSSHKANKSGRGDLGALICRNKEGVEFNIGTGFTDDQRQSIWDAKHKLLGKFAKFKYFPVGVKEAPRHPVFLGWRDAIDM